MDNEQYKAILKRLDDLEEFKAETEKRHAAEDANIDLMFDATNAEADAAMKPPKRR